MAQWGSSKEVFARMMDASRIMEECARRLGVIHEDVRWVKIATMHGNMRDKMIELAHRRADEKVRLMGFDA